MKCTACPAFPHFGALAPHNCLCSVFSWLARLHRLLDHRQEMLTQLRQINLVAKCGAKGPYRASSIILASVEAPIDDLLNTVTQGLEERSDGQRGDDNNHRLRSLPGGQPDQEISLHFFSRSKPHAHSLLVLLKTDPLHIRVEIFLLKSLHENCLEFGSMDRNRACPIALHDLLHRQVHQHIPSPGAKMTKAKRSGNGVQHVGESELVQRLDGIARQNQARSHFAK